MSRRTYFVNPKRKKIIQDAIIETRRVRRSIDPALLQRTKDFIEGLRDNPDKETDNAVSEVPINQKKNLNVISKFLEMTPEKSNLHREIKELFAEKLADDKAW